VRTLGGTPAGGKKRHQLGYDWGLHPQKSAPPLKAQFNKALRTVQRWVGRAWKRAFATRQVETHFVCFNQAQRCLADSLQVRCQEQPKAGSRAELCSFLTALPLPLCMEKRTPVSFFLPTGEGILSYEVAMMRQSLRRSLYTLQSPRPGAQRPARS